MFDFFQFQADFSNLKIYIYTFKFYQMVTNDEEQQHLKQQQKLWNKLFRTDKFSSVIRLPRKYRHHRWDVVRTLGDGKLLVLINYFFFSIFIEFFNLNIS